jgi:glycosyltransferase involved in cell wall biosynthesis
MSLTMHADQLVTVGIPVYNGLPYLHDCIKSLREQTEQNFNILIIDDGSTDGSLEYIRSLRFERLTVLTQGNRGLVPTLNRMLEEVKTPWLVRQDADDISYPNRISVLLKAIQEHPEAAVIHSAARYYPEANAVGHFRSTTCSPAELRKHVLKGYLPALCHTSAALSVQKIRAIGGYRNVAAHVEDADLWWRVALEQEIHYIPQCLVGYRQNVDSVSSKNYTNQMVSMLYVQYLLLSHIFNRMPQPFVAVRSTLERIFPADNLAAKEWLRSFNMHLANKRKLNAALALHRSIMASPRYVCRRLMDEWNASAAVNGIPPGRFLEKESVLWASQ